MALLASASFEEKRPLRVFLMLSSEFNTALELASASRTGNFEVVAAFSANPSLEALPALKELGVRVFSKPIKDFRDAHGESALENETAREAFDLENAALACSFFPDLIVLCGYRYKLTQPFLDAFPAKVLNLHPADLRVKDESGKRKYVGAGAVKKAIESGERETRSTAHFVSNGMDEGPLLLVSEPLQVDYSAVEALGLDAYAFDHEKRMLKACDAPALVQAVSMIARNKVEVDFDFNEVLLNGLPVSP